MSCCNSKRMDFSFNCFAMNLSPRFLSSTQTMSSVPRTNVFDCLDRYQSLPEVDGGEFQWVRLPVELGTQGHRVCVPLRYGVYPWFSGNQTNHQRQSGAHYDYAWFNSNHVKGMNKLSFSPIKICWNLPEIQTYLALSMRVLKSTVERYQNFNLLDLVESFRFMTSKN